MPRPGHRQFRTYRTRYFRCHHAWRKVRWSLHRLLDYDPLLHHLVRTARAILRTLTANPPKKSHQNRNLRLRPKNDPASVHDRVSLHTAVRQAAGNALQKQSKPAGAEIREVFGRGSRVRTRDLRFWRPSLYQLSYTPTRILTNLHAYEFQPEIYIYTETK